MRLRTLETNVGTVLVLDQMTPAEAATAAQASTWPDRDPRPFVLGVVGDVEIPGVDPVEISVAEPSAPGLAEALERARTGRRRPSDETEGGTRIPAVLPEALKDALGRHGYEMETLEADPEALVERVRNIVDALDATREQLGVQAERRRKAQHDLDQAKRELSAVRSELATARAAVEATEGQSPKWQALATAARKAVQGVEPENGRYLLGALEDAVSAVED